MYRIFFLTADEAEITSVPWGSDLTLAIDHAKNHLPAHTRWHGAAQVRIYDMKSQQLVYQFPN
ncbi:hypothetical protein [Asticcacaulis sp. YBE204]|uniref:hypothetical protein n=1 Tax=Asticcacaulis sp. YBE204 TaxID=1282363 RepID=UPI0003C3B0EB|nr:hypothetical protein [Asticcacaulis sp. YBE204]ESQ79710.1 hypothetical protein AEYBE204_07660 [Asticcacaulis sp. YBE204]